MLGLLHTSPVHVSTFDRLRDEEAPGLALRHAVAEELLARARAEGPASASGAVELALRSLVDAGATAVLCTCSTVGGTAEGLSGRVGVPVVRVDRPMAAAAVAAGARIRVLAALASTIGPTVELIEEEATRIGWPVRVLPALVDGAWELFEAGDLAGYHAAVASALSTVDDADIVVLAQASMAPAAALTTGPVPVLSSPRLGLLAAASLIPR